MVTKRSNSETAKQGAMAVYKELGADYNRGLKSIPAFFQKLVHDVSAGLIEAGDADQVFKAWTSGAGQQASATINKMRSYVGTMIKAGAIKGFDNVLKRAKKSSKSWPRPSAIGAP